MLTASQCPGVFTSTGKVTKERYLGVRSPPGPATRGVDTASLTELLPSRDCSNDHANCDLVNGNSADIHRHGDRKSTSKDSIERYRKRREKSEKKISTQQYPDFKPNRLDICDTVFYNVGYFVHDPIIEYAGDNLYQKTSTKNGRQSYFELSAKLPKT